MQTYTPLQPGQAPTLGTSGDAVRVLQENYNKANPTGEQLKTDGLYGPNTQRLLAPKPNPNIVSSTQARGDLATGGNYLDQLTNQTDPYMEYLQKKATGLMTATSTPSTEEKNIANTSAKLQTKTEQDFNAYTAGLETLGIQTGLSRYAPGLQADKLINAANNETAKLADIQDKENLAIAKAKEARINKDSVALKDILSEIKSIRAEKRQALQDQLGKRTQDITVAKSIAPHVIDAFKTLPADQHEALILQLARDNNINPNTLIDALTEAQYQRTHEEQTLALQRKTLNAVAKGRETVTQKKKNDIASAILEFQDKMEKNKWAGVNPGAYKYYKQAFIDTYGPSAALEFDKAISDARLEVDTVNK